ncbi:MAG: nuclear transport factor 2 family protein [Alphaproteobacteria bacterium]
MDKPSPALALVQSLYQKYSEGVGVDALFGVLDPNVQWQSCGPSQPFRTTGVWHGRDGVAAYFGALQSTWTIEEHTPLEFIHQGDRVAVRTRVVTRSKATGQCATVEKADFWTVKDGRVLSYQEIFDTAAAMATCPGQGL